MANNTDKCQEMIENLAQKELEKAIQMVAQTILDQYPIKVKKEKKLTKFFKKLLTLFK